VQRAGGNVQAGWNVILGACYDGDISLGRAAELLTLSRWELQERLSRLEIALRDPDDGAPAATDADTRRA
jgi:predicted HTH domain antitoxin